MQLRVVFLFVFLATAMAQEEDECGEERARGCIERLLEAVLGDVNEDEVCRELTEVTQCLRQVADECLGEERDAEIDEGLEELDNLLAANCPEQDPDIEQRPSVRLSPLDITAPSEMPQCVQDMEDELLECVGESISQVLEDVVAQAEEMDEDQIMCSMYSHAIDCAVERIAQKCGEETSQLADSLFEVPEEIYDKCAANTRDVIQDIINLEKKRK